MEKEENNKSNQMREKDPIITRKTIGRSFHSVVDGSFLTKDTVVGMVPFLLFLLLLAILYISNIYYTEKIIRNIEDSRHEIKDLQYEFITSKSDLMSKSKGSEVARSLESEGILESLAPPGRLYIQSEDTAAQALKNNQPAP